MRNAHLGCLLVAGLLGVTACGKTDAQEPDGDVGKGGSSSTSAGATNGGETSAAGVGASASGGGLPADVNVPPPVALAKLDLLLMVDNSRNTLEKQRLLADAVPSLLSSLMSSKADLQDVHIGVITSSLGAHGAKDPRDVCNVPEDDDHAHLLASLRPNLPSWNNNGFLNWDPLAQAAPPGTADLESLATQLSSTISAAGEHGCGYEASLEAWYRFLVDPEPPLAVVVGVNDPRAAPQGIDEVVLAQRAAFLRPDSVLAIVLMSDENDCSIQDEGYGWLVARGMPMYRSTSACLANPNDPCCTSCGEATEKPGCPARASDSECQKGPNYAQGTGEDDLNLRCWDQKRRFGFDLLYPIDRYVAGLTRQRVPDRSGQAVPNPLFALAGTSRHPSQVIFSGIVGVPWQDLADAASLTGAGLTYLTADELERQGRWKLMLGDPSASPPVLPGDPFMIETTEDRAMLSSVSAHPLVPQEKLVPSSSTNPRANTINGHESVNLGNRLQHACIFPLKTPKDCDVAASDAGQGCLCYQEDLPENNAVCQPPTGGPPGIIQYSSDAFPGGRHLQLMKALGDTAVPASICPKSVDATSPDYGYRPAMKALAARLEKAFDP